jgi:hypothetical protein
VRAHGCRGGREVQDLGRCARQGEGADRLRGNRGCGRRCTRKLHMAARTSRVASVHATSWEGAVTQSARGPNCKAGAARVQRQRDARRRGAAGVGRPEFVPL